MLEDFRRRAHEWLGAHQEEARKGCGPGGIDIAGARHFQRLLHEAGFAGLRWPAEWAGQGLSGQHQRVFDEVAAGFDLPTEPFAIGLTMVGPTLLELGTLAQRARYLPPMLRGEEIWCQLLSEPEAGSDLAALSTRAQLDSDGFTVTGHKIWTSRAQWADLGVLLARTSTAPGRPRHVGLTMLIVDMTAPGMTVRPIRDMANREVFNEVYLDQVKVPAGRIVGERDRGWAAAMAMLAHERSAGGAQLRTSATAGVVARLVDAVAAQGTAHRPEIRQRIGELYVRDRALHLFRTRLEQEAVAGVPIAWCVSHCRPVSPAERTKSSATSSGSACSACLDNLPAAWRHRSEEADGHGPDPGGEPAPVARYHPPVPRGPFADVAGAGGDG